MDGGEEEAVVVPCTDLEEHPCNASAYTSDPAGTEQGHAGCGVAFPPSSAPVKYVCPCSLGHSDTCLSGTMCTQVSWLQAEERDASRVGAPDVVDEADPLHLPWDP